MAASHDLRLLALLGSGMAPDEAMDKLAGELGIPHGGWEGIKLKDLKRLEFLRHRYQTQRINDGLPLGAQTTPLPDPE
jgi:hypothetical protein